MKKQSLSLILMSFFALSLGLLETIFPTAVYDLFAVPAGFLTSLFFGVPYRWTDHHEIVIPLLSQPIHIVPSCSGFGFFCLLFTLSAWHIAHRSQKHKPVFFLIFIPIVYIITILSNSGRMISAYAVHQVTELYLPPIFQAAIHQGIGILIFLSVLMATHLGFENISKYTSVRTGDP